ncbi:MAG: DNA repair protein RecO [Bacillota bacterium]|nr:DNA repair protein RecO [Bacillota bacterium]
MKLLNTRALVLRSQPLGERDRLLSLLTWERGKLSAVAPGARKIKSKLAAGVDYFTCGSFLLHQGKSLYTVNQLEIETNFSRIGENIKDYAYGMYFAELAEKLLEEGESYPDVFDLLLSCWGHLLDKKADRDVLARFFELRILSILGYHPHFQDCLYCGDQLGPFFWNYSSGGVFCGKCRPGEEVVFPFSRGTHALAVRLLSLFPGKIANIRAADLQKKELQDFTWHFLQYWTAAGHLKGLSFLAKVNNSEGDKKAGNAPE